MEFKGESEHLTPHKINEELEEEYNLNKDEL